MGQRVFFLLIAICGSFFCLEANSVRLINNSPYVLRAVIRGGDGSYMGEIVVQAQQETTWTDTYGQFGTSGGANSDANAFSRSKTPYTVLWYCLDGGNYGVCDTVSTGAVVLSQGCMGPRQCKPNKKEPASKNPDNLYVPPSQE